MVIVRASLGPVINRFPARGGGKWAIVCQQLSLTMEQGKFREIILFWLLMTTLWLTVSSVDLLGRRYTKLGFAGNTEPQFIIPSCKHKTWMQLTCVRLPSVCVCGYSMVMELSTVWP